MRTSICIFGASSTYGKGDLELGGWANRLRLDLEKIDDRKYKIYNLGIPGDTVIGMAHRLPGECKFRQPDIIIISASKNNPARRDGKTKVPIDTFKEKLQILYEESKKFTDKILFTGLDNADEEKATPLSWSETCFYNKDIEEYDKILENFCKENNIKFVPMIDLHLEMPDGVHPTPEGHEIIYKRVREAIGDWI